MNDLENYKSLLERFFGAGAATFDVTSGTTNNVIGALNDSQFANFHSSFAKKAKRLSKVYTATDASRKHLLDTFNEVASEKNWEGAYAEVVAFDFLNTDEDWLSSPIVLSKTVPATDTLAGTLGNQNANSDGYYEDFGTCFDVKVLSDKSKSIIYGIIEEVSATRKLSAVLIEPEYPLDLDFEVFQDNRKGLVSELLQSVDPKAQTSFVRSLVVPDLAYRLKWSGGILATIGTYDPFRHALNHHTLLFKHAKKFSRTMPSFITFVIFPWFSEKVITQNDDRQVFYRAFSRRFFCQYAKDTRPGTALLKSFRGSETVAQITEKLSGVLFLEDLSVTTPAVSNDQDVRAFAYLNPNAAHKATGHFREHFSCLGVFVDDFAHDNY